MREQVIRVFLLTHLQYLFLDYGKDVEVSEMLAAEMKAAAKMDSGDFAEISMEYRNEFGSDFIDGNDIDTYKTLNQELARHEMYEECAVLKSMRNKITDSVAVGEIPWLNGTV